MDRPTDRRRFRYQDTSILVCSADGGSLEWLEGFLLPSFDVTRPIQAGSDADYEIRYVVDSQRYATLRRDIAEGSTSSLPCFALDTQAVCLPAVQDEHRTMLLDEPHGCVLLVGRESIEIVSDPAAQRRRLPLLRTVREIAAEAWRRHGGRLHLHAAALKIGGAVVLLAGAKNAGKTTLLVSALDTPAACLVANDRVAVGSDGGRCTVRGLPTLVSIRSGTLARFPALLDDVPAHFYPWSLNDAEWRAAQRSSDFHAKQDHLRLSPGRFAAQLGSDLVAGGRLGAILVCSLDPEVANREVTRLPPHAARAVLETCLYGRGSRGEEPTVIETFVRGTAPDDTMQSLAALASLVPVFECRLGPGAYDAPFDFGALLESRAAQAQGEPDLGVSHSTLNERLGTEVVEVRELPSSSTPGTTARAHRVVLADGRVVKVRRLEAHEDAALTARILAAMDDPRFARLLDSWDEVAIEEWIDGQPLADPPGDDVLRQAGDLLGRLHARDNLDGAALHRMAPTTRDLWRIEHDLATVRRKGGLDAGIARRLLAAAVDRDPGEAVIGLCHRDFCGENMVLDAEGRIRVVDNASLSVAALDFDLQRTAYRWGLGAERWAVFLQAYRAHREPDLGEESAFFWWLRAVTLSARFRLARGAASAAVPLAELKRIDGELRGRSQRNR